MQLRLYGQAIDSSLRICDHNEAILCRVRIVPNAAAHQPMGGVIVHDTGRARIGRLSLVRHLVENIIRKHYRLGFCVIRDRSDLIVRKLIWRWCHKVLMLVDQHGKCWIGRHRNILGTGNDNVAILLPAYWEIRDTVKRVNLLKLNSRMPSAPMKRTRDGNIRHLSKSPWVVGREYPVRVSKDETARLRE